MSACPKCEQPRTRRKAGIGYKGKQRWQWVCNPCRRKEPRPVDHSWITELLRDVEEYERRMRLGPQTYRGMSIAIGARPKIPAVPLTYWEWSRRGRWGGSYAVYCRNVVKGNAPSWHELQPSMRIAAE